MNSMYLNPIWFITGLIWIAALAVIFFILRRRIGWQYAWMSERRRAILLALTCASLLMCLITAAIQAGYENSPDDLRDSEGHVLGFNRPITWGLCRLILRNANISAIVEALMGWYGCLFIGMHLLALAVFGGAVKISPRVASASCWLQLFIFPSGWFGLLTLPFVAVEFLKGEIDGESVSELPLWWTFQPLWLLASALAIIWFRQAPPDTIHATSTAPTHAT